MQVARFPDAEELARKYLADVLGVVTSLERPSADPANGYVVVWRAGGVRDRLLDRPLLNIEVWHARGGEAARLAGEAVDYLVALGGNTVDDWHVTHVVQTGGVVSLPDPDWPYRWRYTAMIELRIRGISR